MFNISGTNQDKNSVNQQPSLLDQFTDKLKSIFNLTISQDQSANELLQLNFEVIDKTKETNILNDQKVSLVSDQIEYSKVLQFLLSEMRLAKSNTEKKIDIYKNLLLDISELEKKFNESEKTKVQLMCKDNILESQQEEKLKKNIVTLDDLLNGDFELTDDSEEINNYMAQKTIIHSGYQNYINSNDRLIIQIQEKKTELDIAEADINNSKSEFNSICNKLKEVQEKLELISSDISNIDLKIKGLNLNK